MVTYNDFAELRNGFLEQQQTGEYDKNLLNHKVFNSKVTLADLRVTIEQYADMQFFQQAFDEHYTIKSLQKKCSTPGYGAIYTSTRTPYNGRHTCTESALRDEAIKLPEVQFIQSLVSDFTHIMLLNTSKNFCELCSSIADRFEKQSNKASFASLAVKQANESFRKYLQCLIRIYPYTWLTFYIDYDLASKYLAYKELANIYTQYYDLLSGCIKSRVSGNYVGAVFYELNQRKFSNEMWDVKIICPGAVIGYTPGMILFGQILEELMVVQD